MRRSLIYLHTGSVFIHDEIDSNGTHKLSQNFHLDDNITLDNETQKATMTNDDASIELIQQLPVNLNMFEGSEDPIRGWMSMDFKKLIPIQSMEYITKEQEFQTMINATEKPVKEVIVEANSYTFVYENGDKERVEVE